MKKFSVMYSDGDLYELRETSTTFDNFVWGYKNGKCIGLGKLKDIVCFIEKQQKKIDKKYREEEK